MRQTSKNVSPMSNEGRNLYVITHITESLLELLKDKLCLSNENVSKRAPKK